MKAVRYAAGALGLGPILALAGPAAAGQAAAAPQTAMIPRHAVSAGKTGKVVRHIRPDATCAGVTEWYGISAATFGGGTVSQRLTFWYANYGTHSHCIGTVIASYGTDGYEVQKPRSVRIDVYDGGALWNSAYETAGPGGTLSGGPTFEWSTPFQSNVPNPVKVCATWYSRANDDVIPNPVCHTLG
jgi:hypothetical protein